MQSVMVKEPTTNKKLRLCLCSHLELILVAAPAAERKGSSAVPS